MAAPVEAALESRKLRSDANLQFYSSSSLYNVFFWVLALIIMLSVCVSVYVYRVVAACCCPQCGKSIHHDEDHFRFSVVRVYLLFSLLLLLL